MINSAERVKAFEERIERILFRILIFKFDLSSKKLYLFDVLLSLNGK